MQVATSSHMHVPSFSIQCFSLTAEMLHLLCPAGKPLRGTYAMTVFFHINEYDDVMLALGLTNASIRENGAVKNSAFIAMPCD